MFIGAFKFGIGGFEFTPGGFGFAIGGTKGAVVKKEGTVSFILTTEFGRRTDGRGGGRERG